MHHCNTPFNKIGAIYYFTIKRIATRFAPDGSLFQGFCEPRSPLVDILNPVVSNVSKGKKFTLLVYLVRPVSGE